MGNFIVKKVKNGFVFNLFAKNGEIIISSKEYVSKAACQKGASNVILYADSKIENLTEKSEHIINQSKYEVYKNKKGEFSFRLKSRNAKIIAVGESYKTFADCVNAIKSVKNTAKQAKVIDDTIKK